MYGFRGLGVRQFKRLGVECSGIEGLRAGLSCSGWGGSSGGCFGICPGLSSLLWGLGAGRCDSVGLRCAR